MWMRAATASIVVHELQPTGVACAVSIATDTILAFRLRLIALDVL
jgi:hypothetical protein